MTYLKRLINSLRIIIITYIVQYLIIIASCYIYKLLINKDINQFINNKLPIIIILYLLISSLTLFIHNKVKEEKIKYIYILPLLSISISLSCLLNMILFKIFAPTPIKQNISPTIKIISSCLIGPIYEEIIFRYIFLHKLLKFNNKNNSIIINSLIFAIIHINIRNIIFSFIISIIINVVYSKHHNILYPIIIHSFINLTSLFLFQYNSNILILSLLNLIIYSYIYKSLK